MFIQLRRPSDDEIGDPKPFQYIPQDLGNISTRTLIVYQLLEYIFVELSRTIEYIINSKCHSCCNSINMLCHVGYLSLYWH